MARVVLCCWGSYGDLFPSLGLAVELKARGHVPVVATCPFYRELVESEGFEFRPVRPDVDPLDRTIIERVMDPVKGSQVVVAELIVPGVRDAYADITEAARGADILLSHPVTFAAPLVATKLGLPWLSTVLSPASFFSVHDFPVVPPHTGLARLAKRSHLAARLMLSLAKSATASWTRPVDAFRAEVGLPPAPSPLFDGQFSRMGTLALFSRVMAEPQPDWPSSAQVTGFPFFNRAIPMPAELAGFLDRGEPPIVFTLGSSAVGAPGKFYDESLRAAVSIGRRAVFLVGKYAPALTQAGVPEGMLVVDLAPHDALFPRAAAIVHHGGVGTTGQALKSGRPMLVVPHAHDQPDNADRVSRLGTGRALDARHYTAQRAADHLRALLEDPGYRSKAEAIGKVVHSERGAAAAVDVIEQLARSGR